MKNSRALGVAARKNDGEYYSGVDVSTANTHADISINVTYPKILQAIPADDILENEQQCR